MLINNNKYNRSLFIILGPQMKSVIRHIVTVDHRDDAIFPTKGSWVQFSSELAGLGGGIANIKNELQAQINKEIGPDNVSKSYLHAVSRL